ncbi:FlgN protein [Pseudobythopirellula maris]|uniref:FlgN protein n=1 Tax=Pseudobythopirellula maris TaxID=2527991 RepID=A0A5C5ZGI4_9BACT|nr:flagellar export chaperone FlgN [Pseudobythopirellula maris]TWT86529.1 FlgN protein [Pseudobythopirellula maris]
MQPFAPTDRSTERLAAHVRDKRALLEQLLEVGRRQAELVASGDVATLLKLVGAKQRLIEALRRTEEGLALYRNDDPEQRVWASPEARAQCAAESALATRLLGQVVALEREHEQAMVARRDAVGAQLQQATTGSRATEAYRPHIRPSAGKPIASPTPRAFVDNAAPPVGGLDLSTGS